MNIREEYLNIVREFTDAPDLFLEASFWVIISTTLGRFLYNPYFPQTKPLRPNIWVMLSGLSGYMRKSTVLDITLNVIENAYLEYYRKILPNIDTQTLKEKVENMKIEFGSPEGILDHISATQDTVDCYIVFSHEAGAIFKAMKKVGYATMLSSLLSTLYSGEPRVWRYAHGKKRVMTSGVYTTGILATQQLWLYIDSTLFQQGLFRRVLIIHQEPEDRKRYNPPLDVKRTLLRDQLEEFGKHLGEIMLQMEHLTRGTAFGGGYLIRVDPSIKAREMINEFSREIEMDIARSKQATNYAIYSSVLWIYAIKIAMLNAIITRDFQIVEGEPIIKMLPEDVEVALDFIRKTIPRTKMAIARTEAPVVRTPIKEVVGPKEVVYSIIASSQDGGITLTDIIKQSRMYADDVKKMILQLAEEGRIIAVWKRSGKRNYIAYYPREHEKYAVTSGIKILNYEELKNYLMGK